MDVDTVLGRVPAARLGATLMHEHLFVVDRNLEPNLVTDWDELAELARATTMLEEA